MFECLMPKYFILMVGSPLFPMFLVTSGSLFQFSDLCERMWAPPSSCTSWIGKVQGGARKRLASWSRRTAGPMTLQSGSCNLARYRDYTRTLIQKDCAPNCVQVCVHTTKDPVNHLQSTKNIKQMRFSTAIRYHVVGRPFTSLFWNVDATIALFTAPFTTGE